MKTLALTLLFAVASAGCLSTIIPDPQPAGTRDGGSTGTGGNGTGTGGGNMNGTGGGDGDMATAGGGADDGGAAPAGTKLFGDTCTVNGDCTSNICGQFVMGTVHRCTKPCTVATQTTDCPAPSDGTCNANGYCKFAQ